MTAIKILAHLLILIHRLFGLAHLIGDRGNKQKEIAASTHCNFSIKKNEKKILFKTLNDRGHLHKAMSMVVDSIIEFIGDENANPKLLCQLSNCTSMTEPIKIDQASVVWQLDSSCPNGILWAMVLDLPFHEQHREYHGIFLKNTDTLKRIKSEQCKLSIYGGKFGYDLSFPHCNPYVLVYGRKKANVNNAVDFLRQAMRHHQKSCDCVPNWW